MMIHYQVTHEQLNFGEVFGGTIISQLCFRKIMRKTLTAIIIVFSLLIISITPVVGQNSSSSPDWTMLESGGAELLRDEIEAIVIDPQTGDCFVTGQFVNNTTFGSFNLVNPHGEDSDGLMWEEIFVARISSKGVWLWAVSAGGIDRDIAYGIDLDEDGGLYITGFFQSNVSFFGTSQLPNDDLTVRDWHNGTEPTGDAFVAKLDSDGNWLWARGIHGNQSDWGASIKSNQNGGIIVAGSFSSGTLYLGSNTIANNTGYGSADIFVAGYDQNGYEQWVKVAGEWGGDEVIDMEIDRLGNTYLVGYIQGMGAYFLPHKPLNTGFGLTEGFVAKLTTNLEWDWVSLVGGNKSEEIYGIDVGEDGDIYVVGRYNSDNISFRNRYNFTSLTLNNSNPSWSSGILISSSDGFVAKITDDGEWVWAKRVSGLLNEEGVAVTTLREHVVVALTSTSDYYSIGNSTFYHSQFIGIDYCIISLDIDGEFEWAIPIGYWKWGEYAELDNDERTSIYIADSFAVGTMKLGNYTAENSDLGLTQWNRPDAFVAKLTLPVLDTDGDGIANWEDADDDNDGIPDEEEIESGSNPLNSDSDGDGFSDSEEINEGTNPMDSDDYPSNDDGASFTSINPITGVISLSLILILTIIIQKRLFN